MALKYVRKTRQPGYTDITTVDEFGNYELKSVWPDGVVTSHVKTTIQKMGWANVTQFLRNKRGFIPSETNIRR